MKKAFALAILAISAIASGAQARQMTTMPADDMRIVYTNHDADTGLMAENGKEMDKATMATAQTEIRHDRSLRAELVMHHVELNNVIEIDRQAGQTVVFVR